jgi:iron(III) transport system permease protein
MVHRHLLTGLCLALLVVFLLWPIWLTVQGGFQDVSVEGGEGWTTQHVVSVFQDPVLRESLWRSLQVAVTVTFLCLVISLPLALLSTRYEFPGKRILSALLLVPLILPPFVGAIGLRQLLGRYGGLNSLLMDAGVVDAASPVDFLGGARFWGVVIMEALHLYPIVYLNVSAALANLDPSLEQAAANLGASRWTRLRKIVLPLIVPGVFAGSTIVLIWSFTELGTPLMFDYYKVAPVQVFWGIQEMAASPRPYALVFVMLLVAVGMYLVGKIAFGGRAHAMTTRAMTGSHTRQLNFFVGSLVSLGFLFIIALALLPHLGVVLTAISEPGSWYRSIWPTEFTGEHLASALSHPLAGGSIRNSLVYSSLAMVVDLFLGFTIAYLIVRNRNWFTRLLDGLAMLPLAVPGLVLAFGYVAMTLRWPIADLAQYFTDKEWFGLASLCQVTGQAPNPLLFLVIAYAVRRLPYIVRSTAAGLEQTSGEMEEAARNLGAKPLYMIRRIVMPLVAANLIAGAVLVFSFAMLEVSDSLILAQVEGDFPMTKAIYALFARLGDGPYLASAMGVWGMALMATSLIAASALLGKKLGAIFRI